MTDTASIWSAVRAQAEIWSEMPVVVEMMSELPRNSSVPPNRGVLGRLQELYAGFATAMVHPLTLGNVVPILLSANIGPQLTEVKADLGPWLTAAKRVSSAHHSTLAWIRSQLPGYPTIRSPELVPEAPLTLSDISDRVPWTLGERRQGLQFQSSPHPVAEMLGSPKQTDKELAAAARHLVSGFRQTDEWKSFEVQVKTLDEGDKEALRAASRRLKQLLAPEMIDAYEPKLLLPRNDYRIKITREVVDSLTGRAKSYVHSFALANGFIDLCASRVFGQLVAFGYPFSVPAFDIDFEGGDTSRIQFDLEGKYDLFVNLGNLVQLNDPLVSDVVMIDSTSFNFSNTGESRLRVGGRILGESAEALSKSADY